MIDLTSNFYVLGCPECDIAKKTLSELESDVTALIVDCDESEKLCRKYELNHLPSLLLYNEDLGVYEYPKPMIYLEAVEDFLNLYDIIHYLSYFTI